MINKVYSIHKVLWMMNMLGKFFSPINMVTLSLCRYCSAHDPNYVEYLAFSDEIESVFTTKGLEKLPTTEVEVFVPPVEVGLRPFSPNEAELLDRTMHRLAEIVSGLFLAD